MGWLADTGFWIGEHSTLGLVLINGAEDSGGAYLSVFIVTQNRLAEFMRDKVNFRSVNVSEDISNNAVTAMQVVTRAEILDQKHKKFLAKNDLAPADIRRRPEYFQARNAKCFHCQTRLDSSTGFECVACGWILCECGACGCTFGGGARPVKNNPK